MAKSSDEGNLEGLGWIDGEVKLIDEKSIKSKTKYPHMGWNSIHQEKDSVILHNLPDESRFYFLHSSILYA